MMCMLAEYRKCKYLHVTDLSAFPEIPLVQLDTPSKMNVLEVSFVVLDTGQFHHLSTPFLSQIGSHVFSFHVTLLCSLEYKKIESPIVV